MLFGKKNPKKETKEGLIYYLSKIGIQIDVNNPEKSTKELLVKVYNIHKKIEQAKIESKNEYDLLTNEEIQLWEYMKKNDRVYKSAR